MNAIINLAFEENLMRVVDKDGAPWFVGKDVCHCLGISKHHQALDALDNDERGTCTVGTPSGDQTMIVVSEPGVYRLVFRSRKPEAERFKRWLAHEVLPQIRRTGQYAPDRPGEAEEGEAAGALAEWRLRLDTVREARIAFGPARAALLWRQLGLPAVPPILDTGREDARQCLATLMAWETRAGHVKELVDAAMDGDRPAGETLRECGVRVATSLDGVYVASSHPGIAAVFAGERWSDRRWYRALLGLPGASRGQTMKFGGNRASHSVFIPLDALSELD